MEIFQSKCPEGSFTRYASEMRWTIVEPSDINARLRFKATLVPRSLRILLAFDVSLRRAKGAMTGKQLQVAQ